MVGTVPSLRLREGERCVLWGGGREGGRRGEGERGGGERGERGKRKEGGAHSSSCTFWLLSTRASCFRTISSLAAHLRSQSVSQPGPSPIEDGEPAHHCFSWSCWCFFICARD